MLINFNPFFILIPNLFEYDYVKEKIFRENQIEELILYRKILIKYFSLLGKLVVRKDRFVEKGFGVFDGIDNVKRFERRNWILTDKENFFKV